MSHYKAVGKKAVVNYRPAAKTTHRRTLVTEQCGHEDLIATIQRWSEAYPIEVFPEPDHKATGHDPTSCSAAMGRHVIGRLMELIERNTE